MRKERKDPCVFPRPLVSFEREQLWSSAEPWDSIVQDELFKVSQIGAVHNGEQKAVRVGYSSGEQMVNRGSLRQAAKLEVALGLSNGK